MAAFLGLFLIGLFALFILWVEGALKEERALIVSLVLIALAMLIRGLCMNHETLDYQNFLTRWVDYFKENGGWKALSGSVGNYNLPYLYFLALFSYSGVRDLYLIKLLSVFFDVALAWAVMRLVYVFTQNLYRVLAAFFITLFLPTVVLNGAYWGQCDSIYAFFAVLSLYLALADRPILSVVSVALSFAFKLQAVFIMPVFLVFLFARKMKWWHLGAFPLTYILTALPAVLTGRPFMDAVLLYFNQAGSVGDGLNYNSPSVFAFIPYGAQVDETLYARLSIAAAFLFLAAIFVYCFLRRDRLDNRALLVCAFLICVGVPFLLPHMHDRYFFIADVLSLALALVVPQLAFVPLCVSFASLLGYHAYLKMRYLLPMRYGAAALLAVILVCAAALVFFTSGAGKKRKKLS